MAAILQSPEDICNAALARLGTRKRIGSLFDGSDESRRFLDIYSQTRDALLREFAWDFANKDAPLTLLKTAPVGGYSAARPWTTADPPMPWIYEYAYPDDMLKLRALRDPNTPIPNFEPRPKLWTISSDTIEDVPVKTIACNLAGAIATYTWQTTDPANWEADFIETLIEGLLRRFTLADPELQKVLGAQELISRKTAESQEG